MNRFGLFMVVLLSLNGSLAAEQKGAIQSARRYSPIISFNLNPQDVLNRQVRVAAREGNLARLREAVAQGGRLDSQSGRGMTALMNASRYCRISALNFLLKEGAALNLTDRLGRTAIMHSAEAACLPAVKRLVAKGADMSMRDKLGRRAIEYATFASTLEVDGPSIESLRLIQSKSRR